MRAIKESTDAELLAPDAAPEAFGAFYRRHLPWILAWLMGKVRDRELAADLAGEVFASALGARAAFDPARGRAEAWLQIIARNVLIDSLRRQQVEDHARQQLRIQALPLSDEDLSRVDALIDAAQQPGPAIRALACLPVDQSEAVLARILEEEEYSDIARRLQCSPAVIRQRVSRGLKQLRTTLEGSSS